MPKYCTRSGTCNPYKVLRGYPFLRYHNTTILDLLFRDEIACFFHLANEQLKVHFYSHPQATNSRNLFHLSIEVQHQPLSAYMVLMVRVQLCSIHAICSRLLHTDVQEMYHVHYCMLVLYERANDATEYTSSRVTSLTPTSSYQVFTSKTTYACRIMELR